VVVGHSAELVTKRIQETAPGWANVAFAEQIEQNGTGDATRIGMAALAGDDYEDDATVLVLPGDTPLLRAETLDELVATHVANGNAATLLTSVLDDPTGYGRVIRAGDRRVLRIVEQRDATPDELDITEGNMGIYVFRRDLLGPALRNLTTDNAQGELYLTDVIGQLAAMGHRVGAVKAPESETQGVNDRWQLAHGRARVPQPHQPPLAAQRRDDARPPPDLHRRHRHASAATSPSTRAPSSRATP
jgi:bifunctional UDP-N-acetylglucosamine pyrophosphorylase / glucosamine-1-phosphate N-acetyltransferase